MNSSPGKCRHQFEAEHRKAWQSGLIIIAATIGLAVHGSRPYGPIHILGIGGGIFSLFFFFGQLVPGSCCLRVCEHGLAIRTLFIQYFIRWEMIQGFSVITQTKGDRVAIHVDPALGIGRTLPLYFTYRLPASELEQTLREELANFTGHTEEHATLPPSE